MSLLDESLARSLEAVKRDLETPLEQSLRAEVARLTERLNVLQQSYDSRYLEVETLDRQRWYRHASERALRDVRLESVPNQRDRGRVLTARVLVDDHALRDVSEDDLCRELVGMLAAQLARHAYGSNHPPERPERAQDPSSEHKATPDSAYPFPGYPYRDTRPPFLQEYRAPWTCERDHRDGSL